MHQHHHDAAPAQFMPLPLSLYACVYLLESHQTHQISSGLLSIKAKFLSACNIPARVPIWLHFLISFKSLLKTQLLSEELSDHTILKCKLSPRWTFQVSLTCIIFLHRIYHCLRNKVCYLFHRYFFPLDWEVSLN